MPTINQNNHMNLDNTPLVQSLGSENAEKVKELNNSNSYEWMLNKWGRKVPVALHLINDKLKRGYIRTDGITYTDDKADRVVAPNLERDPARAMAAVAEQMAKAQEMQAEAIKEIAKKRRNTGKRGVKGKTEAEEE